MWIQMLCWKMLIPGKFMRSHWRPWSGGTSSKKKSTASRPRWSVWGTMQPKTPLRKIPISLSSMCQLILTRSRVTVRYAMGKFQECLQPFRSFPNSSISGKSSPPHTIVHNPIISLPLRFSNAVALAGAPRATAFEIPRKLAWNSSEKSGVLKTFRTPDFHFFYHPALCRSIKKLFPAYCSSYPRICPVF